MESTYDIAVVGGGFFGCSIATELAGQGRKVLLLEQGTQLLGRASYHNQARIHHGYHYPRSVLTAYRSRVSFPRWVEKYRQCVVDDFDHYYAVARRCSKVTSAQFKQFMHRIGAPLTPAPAAITRLFDPGLIDSVYAVQEYAFDAVKLRDLMQEQLATTRVTVAMQSTAHSVRPVDAGLVLRVTQGEETREIVAKQVFNATYSQLNRLLVNSGLPAIHLKHELAEMALVTVPPALEKFGITVMCGPFFSLMPFPSRGLHTLSHVRYTPHGAWQENAAPPPVADAFEAGDRPQSHFRYMLADACRYLPMLAGCVQRDSLWEIKTVLPSSEADDSRPILFRRNCGLKNLHSIMGAKIDNIFDVLDELHHA